MVLTKEKGFKPPLENGAGPESSQRIYVWTLKTNPLD